MCLTSFLICRAGTINGWCPKSDTVTRQWSRTDCTGRSFLYCKRKGSRKNSRRRQTLRRILGPQKLQLERGRKTKTSSSIPRRARHKAETNAEILWIFSKNGQTPIDQGLRIKNRECTVDANHEGVEEVKRDTSYFEITVDMIHNKGEFRNSTYNFKWFQEKFN